MNLFQKYGIKEIVDVVFYSITKIGDEEYYTPVLFLDTLKISTLEKTAQKVDAKGGYANQKLIAWNFGKEISVKLEDALFTPTSMSMIWGGELNFKLSKYTSALVKLNTANKYGMLHYSIYAYPSPALTDEEWELVYQIATYTSLKLDESDEKGRIYWEKNYIKASPNIEENRTILRRRYMKRLWEDSQTMAMPASIIQGILNQIDTLRKIGTIQTDQHDVEVIDRMEKFVVKPKDGITISTAEQKKNLLKYYNNDTSSSYTIYYDPQTMQPIFHYNELGEIIGWNGGDDLFVIKQGTVLYKWSRTVKYKTELQDGTLGKTLVIDAETFPGPYKVVGETYIREQKTGKDQRYQFTINRANISTNTHLSLAAEGEPTVFSMDLDVLTPPNEIMIEFKQFDVDEDYVNGGTRIIPQSARYSYTPSDIETNKVVEFTNTEIF